MGYTTVFIHHFQLEPALSPEQTQQINEWMAQRFGSNTETNVVPHSFYCQWQVSNDGTHLEWDKGEKFYGYLEWLQVLAQRFFTPWAIKVSGAIYFQGEKPDDRGCVRAVPCAEWTTFVVEPFRMYPHLKKQFQEAWATIW